jgi:predicted protein tyrosine phosphatase
MTRRMNALHNCKNPFQGTEKKVLTVCSAGLLRSPTIAWFLSQNGYNTRSCGIHDYALIQLDEVLLTWADIIIFVHPSISEAVSLDLKDAGKEIFVFNIPDIYGYKEPELLDKIKIECLKGKLINGK